MIIVTIRIMITIMIMLRLRLRLRLRLLLYLLKMLLFFLPGVGCVSWFGKTSSRRQHFLFLAKFFFFGVVLNTADVVTDILTAFKYSEEGREEAALLVFIFIFAPFCFRLIYTLINSVRCIFCRSENR
jgi:hypothetical protein